MEEIKGEIFELRAEAKVKDSDLEISAIWNPGDSGNTEVNWRVEMRWKCPQRHYQLKGQVPFHLLTSCPFNWILL